jgi:hypothetical protein
MRWPFGSSKTSDMARAVQGYVREASREPDEADVEWLASVATDGDADRARWELRYARRALALLVAERDAFDDRTASLVSREMRQALQLDRGVAAGMVRVAERQLNERLKSFRTALTERTTGEPVERRLARVLLVRLPGRDASPDLDRAAGIAQSYLSGAVESLRRSFGTPAVPLDEPPSAWRSRQSG